MKFTSKIFSAFTLLILIFSVAPVSTVSAAANLGAETFTNTTAPDWTLLGTAVLTANTIDGPGTGWLRLTDAATNQAGSAISNTAFPSTNGAEINFEYATYGGNGADGFTFYLIDGATASPSVGAVGGSLGYSWRTPAPAAPGVTNGYVGIGFDEFGNFSSAGYGNCVSPSCPGRSPDTIALRGAGNLNTGFQYLTQASAAIATTDRAGKHTVRITITPGQLITVEMSTGSGFTTYVNQFDISSQTLPPTLKMGFSASTGSSTNIHEIRNLLVTGAAPATTALASSLNPSNSGNSVTFTATVTGTGTPTGTVSFYDNGTLLGTGTLDGSGVATFTTSSLTVGAHPITAVYGGDSTFGSSTSNTVNQVVNSTTALIITASGAATVKPGDQYVYTFNYTTSAAANGAQVAFTLPSHTTYVSDSGSFCGSAGGVVTCSLGLISANGSFTVTTLVDKLKKIGSNHVLDSTAYNISATGVSAVNGTATVAALVVTPFADVDTGYWAVDHIQAIWAAGITSGCIASPLTYCPEANITRGEMSVYIERGIHGSSYNPGTPALTFTDTSTHFARYWIEALRSDGITSGCTTTTYCPGSAITRAEMAVFLLRGKFGASHVPPTATGSVWSDVSPSHWAAGWAEELGTSGISSGCGGGMYCPENPVTRAQMAVLMQRTFNLTLPTP
ncbi:MAG: Ig-like domain repeat protein [Chloroflexi bacterium]|nr:Ig-like domain repeat protein [Chloroflexota bacterium]